MKRRYSPIIALLHWGMVGLLSWLIWGGLALENLGFGAEAIAAYSQHKLIGILALALALLRLALRLVFRGPGHESNWRGLMSLGVQRALYGLMLLYPISGYFFHSTTKSLKVPIVVWGWQVPDIGIGTPSFWQEVHNLCLPLLTLALVMHLSGALFHLIRNDGFFQRILPF